MSLRGTGLGRAVAVAVAVAVLDQGTKAMVRANVTPGERIDVGGVFDIVRVANRGIAFGMLDGAGSLVIVISGLAFAALLGTFLISDERPGLWLPIGLLAGGAIGNLIDRVREGFVTDFIDPPRWPAFNLADIAITAGVLLLLAVYIFGSEPDRSERPADPGG